MLRSPQSTDPPFVTVRQAAEALGVSIKLVYKLFHAKRLRGIKVESAVRIDRESLQEYVRRHQNTPPREDDPGAGGNGHARQEPEPATGPRRRATRRPTRAGFVFLPSEP